MRKVGPRNDEPLAFQTIFMSISTLNRSKGLAPSEWDLSRCSEACAPGPFVDEGLVWPLDIDPGRTVLVNRVQNVPPPPAFVFHAFSSSEPLPTARCESIDGKPASERISRRGPVDVAPCLAVAGSSERVAPQVEGTAESRTDLASVRVLEGRKPQPVLRPPRVVRVKDSGTLRRSASRGGLVKVAMGELEAAFSEQLSGVQTG